MRFSSFSDEWTTTILKDSASFYKGTGISKEELSEEGHPCILYGELYTTYKTEKIEDVKSKTSLPAEKLVKSKANDVIIPASGETPIDIATACCIMNDDILLGGDLNIIRIKNHNGVFLSCQLNGKRKLDIAKIAQGASIVHLHNDDLKKLKCYFPKTICEEEKIVAFLSKIDERIETQSKIINCLESLLNEISHHYFGSLSSAEIALSKIADIYQPKTISQSECSENGTYNVFGANGIIGKFNQYNHDLPQICITCRGSTSGNVFMTESYSWITGNAMVINIDKNLEIVNKTFLYYYLSSMSFKNIISGSGQPQIVREPLMKIKIKLPSLEEQLRFEKIISSFASKLQKEKDILALYKKQKAYLLANMFI